MKRSCESPSIPPSDPSPSETALAPESQPGGGDGAGGDAETALAPEPQHWPERHRRGIDLAVVALPVLRPLRLVRLIALIGVLHRGAGMALRGRITAYTAGGVTLLVLVSSLAVLDAERGAPGTPIHTYGEAVWWALATITTVGYGDLAPVTAVGRWAAVLLMIGGVALAGVVTATLASWIVSLVAEESG